MEPSKLELIGQKLDLKTKGFATLRDEVVEKISKDPQSNRFLADFLGLPKRFTTLPAEKYNDFKDLEPGNNQDKAPLLDFQQDVFLKALQELEVPGRRVLIQMPTGSGKTRTALEVVSHFLEKEEHKPVVFWLAHSEELCQQAFDSFESHWCGRLSKPVRVSRLWSQHLVPQSVSKPLFVVASFQKLYGLLEKAYLMEKAGKVPELPMWLSPTQVRVIPVSDKHNKFGDEIAKKFDSKQIRADVDDRSMTIQKRVREAELEWVPYILVAGEKEKKSGKLNVRIRREKGREEKMSFDELIKIIKDEVKGKPFMQLSLPKHLSKRPVFVG